MTKDVRIPTGESSPRGAAKRPSPDGGRRRRWTLEDIPWDAFDAARVDPELVPIVKAASLVEHNSASYRDYLCSVFDGDAGAIRAVTAWAEEEQQHGVALGRWAMLADPEFDFDDCSERFREGYHLPEGVSASVRGSRPGELVARCMVETGTSTYYKVIGDAAQEPVLREICRRIEDDELAHYQLFYSRLQRYLEREPLAAIERIRIVMARAMEAEDDELAFAFHVANGVGGAEYDRVVSAARYLNPVAERLSYRHCRRLGGLIVKAIGGEQTDAVTGPVVAGVFLLATKARARLLSAQARRRSPAQTPQPQHDRPAA